MTYPTFKTLEKTVLIGFLQFLHESDQAEYLDFEEIPSHCSLTISRVMLYKVLDSLLKRGWVENFVQEAVEDGDLFTLTLKGIEAAERSIASLDDVARSISTIPAADRVVELSDNQVSEAQKKLEEATEVVRSSNQLEPEKRAWLIEQFSFAKLLVGAKKVSTSAFRNLVIEPLYTAWKAVAEDSGKEALLAVVKFFKNLAGWS